MKFKTKLLATAAGAALVLSPLAPVVPGISAVAAIAKDGNGGGNGGGNGAGNGNGGGNGNGNAGGNGKGHGNSGGNGNGHGNSAASGSNGRGSGTIGGLLGDLFGNGKSKAKDHAGRETGKAGPRDTVTAVTSSPRPPAAPKNHGAVASELKGLNAAHASATGFANAAPNSRVGHIATYAVAAGEISELKGDLGAALAALSSSVTTQSTLDATARQIAADLEAERTAPTPDADRIAALEQDLEAAQEAAATNAETVAALGEQVDAIEDEIADTKVEASEAFALASGGRTLSDLSPEAQATFEGLIDGKAPEAEPAVAIEVETTETPLTE